LNNLINTARHIAVNEAVQTVSVNPVTIMSPLRAMPLEMRITAPAIGANLPLILFSHGHGPSLYLPSKDGYGPLVNFYAEHGFVVIQPTHANSKVAGFGADAPGAPLFWRSRAEDIKLIVARLRDIEAMVPAIAGRLDHSKVAAVGHSLGGQTVGMLLGARLTDPNDRDATDVSMVEPGIKAGVLLAAPGNGGANLSRNATDRYSALNPDFSHMTTRSLVVAGDADVSPHLTVRGADWHTDPYYCSPGADALLILAGARHGLGGIAGYDAKEADDENPDRLAVTQRMTWAYLRSALYEGDTAWADACEDLKASASALGNVEFKPGWTPSSHVASAQ
jgi:predicted dienelactone hydrolase